MTLYYVNLGSEYYDDLNDYKNFLKENEASSKSSDFLISALLLRLWRRNFKLNFLPVEFLDFLIVNYKSELISESVNLKIKLKKISKKIKSTFKINYSKSLFIFNYFLIIFLLFLKRKNKKIYNFEFLQ